MQPPADPPEPEAHGSVPASRDATISADDGVGPSDTAASLRRGDLVGRYVVIEMVGAGAMGSVYAAYDPELDRRVAVKVLRAGRTPTPESRARLLREAQAIAKLSHPSVITVHDVGEVADRLFLAMEFVDGGTLTDWLRAAPRTWREILLRLRWAGEGLAAAHDAGIVHRDFKPENVLIARDGRVKVADFGIARWGGGTSRPALEPSLDDKLESSLDDHRGGALTKTGAVLGTPAYMAPEQHGVTAGDPASDQFAFGVTAYEALCGVRPFRGSTIAALLTAKLDGAMASPASAIPGWILRVIRRALAPDPAARWPSMHAMLDAMARDPASTRTRALALAGVLVAGAAMGIAIDWSAPKQDPPCPPAVALLEESWNPARAEALQAAFIATDLPYAPRVFASVRAAVDDYTASWIAMRQDACEATWVRREQSGDILDARIACLDNARSGLASTLAGLEAGSPEVVEHAVQLLSSLPRIDDCSRDADLAAWRDLPSDPSKRAAVLALRDRMTEMIVSSGLRPHGEREHSLQAIYDEARVLGDERTATRAQIDLAEIAESRGELDRARELFEEALWDGIAQGSEAAAYEAIGKLMWLDGFVLADIDAALERERAARALLRRLGNGARHEAALLNRLGAVYFRAGRRADAIAAYRRAIELAPRGTLNDRLFAADLEFNVASIMIEDGLAADAVERFDEVERVWLEAVGPDHPEMGIIAMNRATALGALGRLESATEAARRSVQIYSAAGGFHTSNLAEARRTLAHLLGSADRNDEALAEYQAALTTIERVVPPGNPRLEKFRMSVVDAMLIAKRDDEAARFVASWREVAPAASAPLRYAEGLIQRQAGERERALAAFRDATKLATQADRFTRDSARRDTAFMLLELGRKQEARTLLRELLMEASVLDPSQLVKVAIRLVQLERELGAAPETLAPIVEQARQRLAPDPTSLATFEAALTP